MGSCATTVTDHSFVAAAAVRLVAAVSSVLEPSTRLRAACFGRKLRDVGDGFIETVQILEDTLKRPGQDCNHPSTIGANLHQPASVSIATQPIPDPDSATRPPYPNHFDEELMVNNGAKPDSIIGVRPESAANEISDERPPMFDDNEVTSLTTCNHIPSGS